MMNRESGCFINYLAAGKEYIRHHLPQQALVSAVLFGAAPLIAGVENLSQAETAQLLDFYAVLPGMILLIPIFLPEQNPDIRDLIRSKYTSMGSIYLIRILLSALVMVLLTTAFVWMLKQGGCSFPAGKFLLAALSGMIFLGGLGAAAYALSGNPVIGYMASLAYYLFAFGTGEKYLGNWFLFSLSAGGYTEKRYLAVTGLICLLMAVWVSIHKERS